MENKKLYLCLVNCNTSADMVIEADSEQEARKIAEKLADNGKGEMTISDTGSASVSDIQQMEAPEEADKEQATTNLEAWEELQEEERGDE